MCKLMLRRHTYKQIFLHKFTAVFQWKRQDSDIAGTVFQGSEHSSFWQMTEETIIPGCSAFNFGSSDYSGAGAQERITIVLHRASKAWT